jgi:hypothetical protein
MGILGGRTGALGILFVSCFLCGCGFLPGFDITEQPTLSYLPVSEVSQQVSCELKEFIFEYRERYLHKKRLDKQSRLADSKSTPEEPRWVLAEDDAVVKLNLQTDETGYVNFTGINVSQLGLNGLQNFITSSTSGKVSIPSLGAKATAKRTKNVTVTFSVGVKPKTATKTQNPNDPTLYTNDPATKVVTFEDGDKVRCVPWANNYGKKLYLKEWLLKYFETINAGTTKDGGSNQVADNTTQWLAKLKCNDSYEPAILSNPCVPDNLKVTSVELKSMIMFAVDVSAGATPSLLGNGSVFILPINGLGVDYNPDYSHQIDLTLNICDNQFNQCPLLNNAEAVNRDVTDILQTQCQFWATLGPILTGMKAPVDVYTELRSTVRSTPGSPVPEFRTCSCNKCTGQYELQPEKKTNQHDEKACTAAPSHRFGDSASAPLRMTPILTEQNVCWVVAPLLQGKKKDASLLPGINPNPVIGEQPNG